MKISKADHDAAVARLRELLPPGATVYTILRHVSRSGMQRGIDVIALYTDARDGSIHKWWLSRLVSKATGIRFDDKRECLSVQGAGMDMGFHVVDTLAYAIRTDSDPRKHYDLRQEWI